jgi:phosphoadenosine phosphosulfate reductase
MNQAMETWSAEAIVDWATREFGSGLCLTASLADTTLIDVAVKVDPEIEVVFLDTGFHFAETLGTLRQAMRRHRLRVNVVRPETTSRDGRLPDPWTDGTEACCKARKVDPLDHALAGRQAWLSGLRRSDSADRANAPIVSIDRRGLVKINPIAAWTDDDVERYQAANDPVVNPLAFQGYPSIGCWPCTLPVEDGNSRDGRWAGSTKTECGIHL